MMGPATRPRRGGRSSGRSPFPLPGPGPSRCGQQAPFPLQHVVSGQGFLKEAPPVTVWGLQGSWAPAQPPAAPSPTARAPEAEGSVPRCADPSLFFQDASAAWAPGRWPGPVRPACSGLGDAVRRSVLSGAASGPARPLEAFAGRLAGRLAALLTSAPPVRRRRRFLRDPSSVQAGPTRAAGGPRPSFRDMWRL